MDDILSLRWKESQVYIRRFEKWCRRVVIFDIQSAHVLVSLSVSFTRRQKETFLPVFSLIFFDPTATGSPKTTASQWYL
jgi:hypothetical protein